MYQGIWAHATRMLLKGGALGAVLGPALAMVMRALVDVIAVTSQKGGMDIASVIVGFPVFLLSVILEAGLNGDLLTYTLIGLFTGLAIALVTVLFSRWLKPLPMTVLCAGLAALVVIVYMVIPQGAASGALSPVMAGSGPIFEWTPNLVYIALAAWMSWQLRRGSVA